MLLGVITRALEGLTGQKRMDIKRHREELEENEFNTIPAEDMMDEAMNEENKNSEAPAKTTY